MSKFYLAIQKYDETNRNNPMGPTSEAHSVWLVDKASVARYLNLNYTIYELDSLKEITKAHIELS